MADEEDLSGAVPATSVQDEYAKIHAEPCACGGLFSPAAGMKGIDIGGPMQQLVVRAEEGKAYDVMRTACLGCGAKRRYVFDISSFFFKSGRGAVAPQEHYKDTPWSILQMAVIGSLMLAWCFWTTLNIFSLLFFPLGCLIMYEAATCGWRLVRGGAPPAAAVLPAGADDPDAALAALGIPPGASQMTDPQDAMLDGLAGASLMFAAKQLADGKRAEALATVQKLLGSIKTDSPRRRQLASGARVLEGMLLARDSKRDEAVASFWEALELYPENAAARKALAAAGQPPA